jgi:membrane protein implicated in regulation of membrane protease activity
MWCHALLMMPLLGLGLFALLPWPVALPSYLALVAVSLALYGKILQGMRQPVQTGREVMLGAVVTVTRDITSQGQVRYGNELWGAVSEQQLTAGQRARIVGFDGLRLVVRRLDDSQHRREMSGLAIGYGHEIDS